MAKTEEKNRTPEIINPNEVAPQIIADSLVSISNSMKKALTAGLTKEAIVTLVHAKSKVPKRDIEIVINNLVQLQSLWTTRKS